jgi:hypothetical protein
MPSIFRIGSKKIIATAMGICSITSMAVAATPLWTFLPLTYTTITVASNGFATIQYQITNQSRKPHTLVMRPLSGITQVTTVGNCPNQFSLDSQQSCTLTLEATGSTLKGNVVGGPEVCQQGGGTLQCYQPSHTNIVRITLNPEPGDTTLLASASSLLLSVNDTATNSELTGKPRIISIVNIGTLPASDVHYVLSPALPTGTSIAPASCSTIAPGGTCELTITPGTNPTTVPASGSGSAPIPSVVTVSSSNSNSTTTDVTVLTYGNIVQSGLIFSIDDATADTRSVEGKVVTDIATEFSSSGTFNSNNNITGARGPTDGLVNTDAIVMRNACTNFPNNCAALRCRNIASAWYLPASDELSNVAIVLCYSSFPCNFGGFSDNTLYWSSSQSSNQNSRASSEYLTSNSVGLDDRKDNSHLVRCVMVF